MTALESIIYLDHNATTPCDDRVVKTMQPYFTSSFGNASSATHPFGWQARDVVEAARAQIAKDIGAAKSESIVFTRGTTESNNTVIAGIVAAFGHAETHLITQSTEHDSVHVPLNFSAKNGAALSVVDADASGWVDPEAIANQVIEKTRLVSVMHANNEIGTIQNIKDIVRVVKAKNPNVLVHTDAAQTIGVLDVSVADLGVDFMSFSAHKLYGPKGVGALFVSPFVPSTAWRPLLFGGGQERGLRSGTVNVPGVIGLAQALTIAKSPETKAQIDTMQNLRERLWRGLQNSIDDVILNGHVTNRLPHNLNVSFRFAPSDQVLLKLPTIALSTGSACGSGKTEPSRVILALQNDQDQWRAKTSLRFGLGRSTTAEQIDIVVDQLAKVVARVRENSLEHEMHKQRKGS